MRDSLFLLASPSVGGVRSASRSSAGRASCWAASLLGVPSFEGSGRIAHAARVAAAARAIAAAARLSFFGRGGSCASTTQGLGPSGGGGGGGGGGGVEGESARGFTTAPPIAGGRKSVGSCSGSEGLPKTTLLPVLLMALEKSSGFTVRLTATSSLSGTACSTMGLGASAESARNE